MGSPSIQELPYVEDKIGWPWAEGCEKLPDKNSEGKLYPKISIVTPSFNQGRFIEETIRSVLLQGYPNLEYIIMDGGSTDNTLDVIKKYEKWLSCISEPDNGQAHAINKGWRMATGDILGWLNSDDMYAPKALQYVGDAWLKTDNPGMIYGDAFLSDINLVPRKKKVLADYSLKKMFLGKRMTQPSVFISRNFVGKLGFLRESLYYSLDFDFFLRAWLDPESCNFYYVPHALSYSREYADTKCGSGGSRRTDENADVLRKLWNEHMLHYHSSREWRYLFSVSLGVLAKREINNGRYINALQLCHEAFRWSLKGLPNITKTLFLTLMRRYARIPQKKSS